MEKILMLPVLDTTIRNKVETVQQLGVATDSPPPSPCPGAAALPKPIPFSIADTCVRLSLPQSMGVNRAA